MTTKYEPWQEEVLVILNLVEDDLYSARQRVQEDNSYIAERLLKFMQSDIGIALRAVEKQVSVLQKQGA